MRQDRNAYEVYIIDCGYLNAQDPNAKISNFKNWVEEGCPDESESKEYIDIIGLRDHSVSYIEPYDVILVSAPKNGSKDLLVAKQQTKKFKRLTSCQPLSFEGTTLRIIPLAHSVSRAQLRADEGYHMQYISITPFRRPHSGSHGSF
ncbi:hypothetical protein [Acetivibrio cellulolyticus]|uniref:hypothetical protein n=1 Tax=Acetivibrio cellulolyticus TaxID=35830 RepID=UPI0001E2C69E|nr:hypothetical protein [Acetivibrio cellulolyticus]